MKIPSLGINFRDIRAVLDKNSPVILTGMAVGGTFLSVYLTYKGAVKGTHAIDEANIEKRTQTRTDDQSGLSLTNQEKFLLTYKFYLPAAASVVGTSGCMIMATKIGLDRTAAMAGALVIAERANDQYKDKVKEILGENKHLKVSDAVAADQVAAMGPMPAPREGEQIFIDSWTSRTISTTMERMERAVNDFNKDMLYNGYASLNEFYSRFDLDEIQSGNHLGWSIGDGRDRFLELVYTTVLKDDRAVVSFKFARDPMPNFREESP